MEVLRVDGDLAVINDGVVERQIRFSYKPVTVSELVEIIEFLEKSYIVITDYHIANSFMFLGIARVNNDPVRDGKISYSYQKKDESRVMINTIPIAESGVPKKRKKSTFVDVEKDIVLDYDNNQTSLDF